MVHMGVVMVHMGVVMVYMGAVVHPFISFKIVQLLFKKKMFWFKVCLFGCLSIL